MFCFKAKILLRPFNVDELHLQAYDQVVTDKKDWEAEGDFIVAADATNMRGYVPKIFLKGLGTNEALKYLKYF